MAKGAFSEFEPGGGAGGSEGEDGDNSAEMDYEDGGGMMVDLSGTSENIQYKLVPRGIYDAELIEMEYGQSQRSQNNMWTTIWELDSEEFADEKGNRSRQWMHLTFTDGGLPRIKRFLTRVGGDDELVSYARSLLTTKFDPQAVADEGKLIGARARLRIDIRRYEGQNRNNVREILPPGADQSGAAAKGAFANV